MFNAAGSHTLQARLRLPAHDERHQLVLPGRLREHLLGQRFTFDGRRGAGTYGYYEVNDRRITNLAGNNIHSLFVQDQWTRQPR